MARWKRGRFSAGRGGFPQDSWFVGRHNDSGFDDFQGAIHDIRVFNTVLTDQEVADLYAHTMLPIASVVATDGTATEGSLDLATLTVTLDKPAPSDLTVALGLASSTAVYGADWTSVPDISGGSVVVPSGQDHIDIIMTAVADATAEGRETVVLGLLGGIGYFIDGTQPEASATVIDSDAATFWVEATDTTATEDTDTATFVLHRDQGGPAGTVVCMLVASGASGSQYTLSPSVLDLALVSGAAQNIILTPTFDTTPEADMTVTLSIQASGTNAYFSVAGAASADATIIDDDPPFVMITATDPTAVEDPASPDTGEFTIARIGPTVGDLIVSFSIAGTATAGTDYVDIGSSITIPDGSASITLAIEPIDDDQQTPPRTVVVLVLDASGGEYYAADSPDDSATVEIQNDDIHINSFALLGPADATFLEIDAANTFTCETAAGNTTLYTVEVADQPTFAGSIGVGQSPTPSVTIAADSMALAYDTTYYWRVRAASPNAVAYSTNCFAFTTNPDTRQPQVVQFSSAATDPTNGAPFPVTITFSEPVSGFAVADLVVANGTLSAFSGSGADYTVTLTPWAAGAVTLDIPADVCQDMAGNLNGAATQFGRVCDVTSPVVVSIERAGADPTIAGTLVFTVTFSEHVLGVDISDFSLTPSGTSSGVVALVALVSNSVYAVTVTNTGGPGTLCVDLDDDDSIVDIAGNTLAGAGTNDYTSGDAYTILSTAAPTVVSITPGPGEANVAPGATVVVTFSKPMDSTATAGAFMLSEPAGVVGGVVSFSAGGDVLTFTPAAFLAEDTTYTVTIGTSAVDAVALPLVADYSSTFVTLSSESGWDCAPRAPARATTSGMALLAAFVASAVAIHREHPTHQRRTPAA